MAEAYQSFGFSLSFSLDLGGVGGGLSERDLKLYFSGDLHVQRQ